MMVYYRDGHVGYTHTHTHIDSDPEKTNVVEHNLYAAHDL